MDNPGLAADPAIAAEIAVYGLLNGTFVPNSGPLSDYVSGSKLDYSDVRTMINPGDSSTTYQWSDTYATAFAGHTGGC